MVTLLLLTNVYVTKEIINRLIQIPTMRKYSITLPSVQLFFSKSIEKVINHYSEVTDSFGIIYPFINLQPKTNIADGQK